MGPRRTSTLPWEVMLQCSSEDVVCHMCRERELQAEVEVHDLQASEAKIASKLERLHLASDTHASDYERAAVHRAKAS